MDRKTLEYMEERSKKAREIVKKIDRLIKDAERLVSTEKVSFSNFKLNFQSDFYSNTFPDLTRELVDHAVKTIIEEINRLEQELAEL